MSFSIKNYHYLHQKEIPLFYLGPHHAYSNAEVLDLFKERINEWCDYIIKESGFQKESVPDSIFKKIAMKAKFRAELELQNSPKIKAKITLAYNIMLKEQYPGRPILNFPRCFEYQFN